MTPPAGRHLLSRVKLEHKFQQQIVKSFANPAGRPRFVSVQLGGQTIQQPEALTLVLIPTFYVILGERFPRRDAAPEGVPALQGDTA